MYIFIYVHMFICIYVFYVYKIHIIKYVYKIQIHLYIYVTQINFFSQFGNVSYSLIFFATKKGPTATAILE